MELVKDDALPNRPNLGTNPLGSSGSGVVIPVSLPPPPSPLPLTGLNRFTLDDDEDEA